MEEQVKEQKFHNFEKFLLQFNLKKIQVTWTSSNMVLKPSRSVHFRKLYELKINLSFYIHTHLWCLKKFYEVLEGLHKTFWGTTKKCENKNLSKIFLLWDWDVMG